MENDWAAVAGAIQARLRQLDMTQDQLAKRSGVALETVRELRLNLVARRRNASTLAAISGALGWPGSHLARVRDGQQPSDPLVEVHTKLRELDERLETVEQQVSRGEPS